MGVYASLADLRAATPVQRLLELAQREDGALDEPRLQQALNDAAAEIDSYLGLRHALPLSSPPPMLRVLAIDITLYRLMSLYPAGDLEDARQRYSDAVAWLKYQAANSAPLPGTVAAAAPTVQMQAGRRIFGGGRERGG